MCNNLFTTRKKALALTGCACVIAAGCGGVTKSAPTQREAQAISAAVSDIVTQCQSAAAGFVAGPDAASLRRDVDALVQTYGRVRANARFVVGSSSGVTLATTPRKELSLAEQNLAAAGCAPRQAIRLQGTLGG
jgi:hypothetical protein